jgi:hypothetical protein
VDEPPVDEPPIEEPLPSEPAPVVLPEVPPAPLVVEPSSFRQRSLSSPTSASQRDAPTLAPVEAEPVTPVDEVPVLLPLEPTEGVVLAPLPMLLEPALPGALPELWANAPDVANSAAAVAETMSLRFMCVPL